MLNKHLPGQHNQKKHGNLGQRSSDIVYLVSRGQSTDEAIAVARNFDNLDMGSAKSFIQGLEKHTGFVYSGIHGDASMQFKTPNKNILVFSVGSVPSNPEPGAKYDHSYALLRFGHRNDYDTSESVNDVVDTFSYLVDDLKERGIDRIETGAMFMPVPILASRPFVAYRGPRILTDGWNDSIWKQSLVYRALMYIRDEYNLNTKEPLGDWNKVKHPDSYTRYVRSLPQTYKDFANSLPNEITAEEFFDIRHPDYPELPLFTESIATDTYFNQPFYMRLK